MGSHTRLFELRALICWQHRRSADLRRYPKHYAIVAVRTPLLVRTTVQGGGYTRSAKTAATAR